MELFLQLICQQYSAHSTTTKAEKYNGIIKWNNIFIR